MSNAKHGLPRKERLAQIRGQVTDLLWYGKIETTPAKAKSVAQEAEKLLTLAINSFENTNKVMKEVTVDGIKSEKEFINDGAEKLAARREIMSRVYDKQEQRVKGEKKTDFVSRTENIFHPLIEKMFNTYAPKYAQRAKEKGTAGGYTRIIKIGARRGDNAERAIIELV